MLALTLAVLLAVPALLLVPLHVALDASGDTARGYDVVLRYRTLLVLRGRRTLRRSGAGRAADERAKDDAASSAASRARAGSSLGARLRSAVTRLDVLERVLRSRAVRVERPAGWLVLGCADPAETGIVFGHACALAALVDPAGAIALAPLWTFEDRLAGEVTLAVRVVPLGLAVALAVALLAPRRRAAGAPRVRRAA